jgi:protein CWC15
MSTGHRPTFHPAVGKQIFGGGSGYHIVSVKDQLGQKNLKFRKFGQSSQSEIRSRDYKAELEIIEQEHLSEKQKEIARVSSSKPEKSSEAPRLLTDAPSLSVDELRKKYDDADADNGNSDNDLEPR